MKCFSLSLLLVLPILTPLTAQPRLREIGYIEAVVAPVMLRRGTNEIPAKAGEAVRGGDQVKCGTNGQIIIRHFRAQQSWVASNTVEWLAVPLPPPITKKVKQLERANSSGMTTKGPSDLTGLEPLGALPGLDSAALFVGINEFRQARPLGPLIYAVNDAVAQASLFVSELKLFPAANVYLALAGEPTTPELRAQRDALVALGARVITADKLALRLAITEVVDRARGPDGLLVISLSTHGFRDFVLGAEGLDGPLEESGLRVAELEARMMESLAGKRLLILDTCRSGVSRSDRGEEAVMADVFQKALGGGQGQVVLASCQAGQTSLEHPALQHGVFTWHLLEALRGQADPDRRGYVTLSSLSEHLSRSVPKWVAKTAPDVPAATVQQPWFKDADEIGTMPLAASRKARAAIERAGPARAISLGYLAAARLKYPKLLSEVVQAEVEEALDAPRVPARAGLLEQLRLLKGPAEAGGAKDEEDWKRSVRNFVEWWKQTRGRALPSPFGDAVPDAETYLPSAREGSLFAMQMLSLIYYVQKEHPGYQYWKNQLDEQVRKSPEIAARLHRPEFQRVMKLAAGGSPFHQLLLRELLNRGIGTGTNRFQEADWFHQQEEQRNNEMPGVLEAVKSIAQGASGRPGQSLDGLREAAEKGNAVARNELGFRYALGRGVEKDSAAAVEWFRQAAEQGHAKAQNNLGAMYYTGDGVARDDRQAVTWYRKAAESGYAQAQYNLATMLENGRGVTADDKAAAEWYQKAARQGHPGAQYSLAVMHEDGVGVPKNKRLAVYWYRKAAAQGDDGARRRLKALEK